MNPRLSLILAFLPASLLATACGGDDDDGTMTPVTPTPTVAPTPTETPTPTLPPQRPRIIVSPVEQAVTTIVTIEEARAFEDFFIVIQEQDDDGPAAVIGVSELLASGDNDFVEVWLSRPTFDGEVLYATLYADTNGSGAYEPPDDDLVEGDRLQLPFEVAHLPGAAEARFVVGANGITDFIFESVAPDNGEIGEGDGDQTLALEVGRRYAVRNLSGAAHPFEVLTLGDNAGGDRVLLSELEDVTGFLELDEDIAFTVAPLEGRETLVSFTVTPRLALELTGYRCGIHTTMMRGAVELAEPPPGIDIRDQTAADVSLRIDVVSAASEGPGVLVLQGDLGNGSPGDVLATAYLEGGIAIDIPLWMNRALAAEPEALFLTLHTDVEPVGEFSLIDDLPVLVGGSEPLRVPIAAQRGPDSVDGHIVASDQILESSAASTIAVSFAAAAAPGHLVAHAGSADGESLGSVAVPAGPSADHSIALSRALTDGETLVVVLHADDAGEPGDPIPGVEDELLVTVLD